MTNYYAVNNHQYADQQNNKIGAQRRQARRQISGQRKGQFGAWHNHKLIILPNYQKRFFLGVSAANCSISSFWWAVSLVGVSTLTITIWSPRLRPAMPGTPLSLSRKTLPLWVPAGILSLTSPSTVMTATSPP